MDSLYVYPTDSNSWHNISASVTDPWGNTIIENFSVYIEGCSTVLTEFDTENEYVKIFPNPTIEIINVHIRCVKENNILVSLYNCDGSLYKTEKAILGLNQIDIKELPSGLYFIKVQGDDFMKSEKVIIY